MTVSINKKEWICETCHQGQIDSLQWQIRVLFIQRIFIEHLLCFGHGCTDAAIDNTKSLPYGALWCIPVGKAEINKYIYNNILGNNKSDGEK